MRLLINRLLTIRRANYFVIIGMMLIAAVALALPAVHSDSVGSSSEKSGMREANSLGRSRSWGSVLPLPTPTPESIATFASDCVTPKSSFFLGEAVCAKTDDVDLGFSGGRWVHWLREDLSIAHGSSTTTLITTNPQTFTFVPDQTGTWKATIAETGDDSQTPAHFSVSLAPETIATFDGGCSLANDNFSIGDMICAQADPNFTGNRFIYWVNSQGDAVFTDVITSASPTATRQINDPGVYWVYFSDTDGSLRDRARFTVSNAAAPKADLGIIRNAVDGDFTAGSFVSYRVIVSNQGPDSAASVVLTEPVATGLTDVTVTSSSQDSGPEFNCTAGVSSTSCTIASLAPGISAHFTFVYQVNSGLTAGSEITNTGTVASATAEIFAADNTAVTIDIARAGGGAAPACTLDCPNHVVTTATTPGAGGGANVTFALPEAFGSCGTVTASPPSGEFFPIGTTTVNVSSATGDGFCTFKVTVVDSAAPTISCPANTGATANAGQAFAFVPNPNGSSSNVGSPNATGTNIDVTGSRDDGEALTSTYPVGETVITWTATEYDDDPQSSNAQPTGRSATCQQEITVTSPDAPQITCPSNKNFNASSGCEYTATPAEIGNPTTSGGASSPGELCPLSNPCAVRSDGLALTDPFPAGQTTITWTATNDVGSDSCTQIITVAGNDSAPPTLDVPASITTSTDECSVLLGPEPFVATADDNCSSSVNISRTGMPQIACPVPGNPGRMCDSFVFPTGTTVITYTATDSNGNTATGTQTVTVNENPNTNPTITAPQDLTVNTGPDATTCGVFIGDATLGSATANDNCAGVTVTRTGVPAGNNFPLGTTTITYTATDRVGNTAIDTQVVTVIDNTPPVITLNQPEQNPQYVECHTSYTELGATATDNCPTSPFAATPSGTVDVNTPGTYTITYNATDSNGNAAAPVTRTVIVRDTIAPVITVNTFSPTLWPPNHKYKTFQLTQFVTGASDSCDVPIGLNQVVIEKVTSDETENGGGDGNTLNDMVIAGDCKSVQLRAERNGGGNGRVYTITFMVTDASGNVGRATAKVKVPHNNGSSAVEDAVQYTVNGSCP